MKNLMQRFAARTVFGILILGALLAGCSSNQATAPVDESKPVAAGASKGVVATDSAGKPINPTNP